eukprot:scaffold4148_cov240-Pinguiococcus_pyrenoidosus.AAC.1
MGHQEIQQRGQLKSLRAKREVGRRTLLLLEREKQAVRGSKQECAGWNHRLAYFERAEKQSCRAAEGFFKRGTKASGNGPGWLPGLAADHDIQSLEKQGSSFDLV